MSVQSHIENLRSKPEHVRRRIAFWSSFGMTAVIFVFWMASFTAAGDVSQGALARTVEKAGSPAQSLVAAAGSFWNDVSGLIFTPKKVQYGTIEVVPGK